jgi:tetraacyldisaccharide 4'-kinase
MRAPDFWQTGGSRLLPTLLTPVSWFQGLGMRVRFAMTRPWRAPVPVLCVGNLVAGGAGKTPVALSLGGRLLDHGLKVHYLSRGYGGRQRGPVRVDAEQHTSIDVGDEALLLAQTAPTWVARHRAKGCRAAVAAGAEVIVMDDGFQNPSLAKDVSLLVVDGGYGFGNGRLIPAGPLREPVEAGLGRADGVVLMGDDTAGLTGDGGPLTAASPPTLRAAIKPGPEAAGLAGKPVVAFAGIARPEKFFQTLRDIGCQVVVERAFSDHYPYEAADIERILRDARAADAIPVTTAKDIIRLPPEVRDEITVLTIAVAWEDEAAVDAILEPLTRHGR